MLGGVIWIQHWRLVPLRVLKKLLFLTGVRLQGHDRGLGDLSRQAAWSRQATCAARRRRDTKC